MKFQVPHSDPPRRLSLSPTHQFSFQSSLNSIDENNSLDNVHFRKRSPDVYSNYLPLKRQSDPTPSTATRYSFYNKLFDMNDNSQRLSPPQKDFRKYSLPLSMRFRQESPVPSMSNAFKNVSTWQSYKNKANSKKTKLQDNSPKFKWTINDEDGQEIKNSLFDSLSSPNEDFQCLHFEENFVKLHEHESNIIDNFDQLNEKFLRKLRECEQNESFLRSQSSTESVIDSRICKNCGHDITRL